MGITEEKRKNCSCRHAVASPEKEDTGNIFAPLKGKMKVLKKIKKRMGLASRSSSNAVPGPNNLPPLLFHNVHGDNIRISRDGAVARRVESFCKGIAFSARPVKVNERIHIKFLEISNNWSGVLRLGFTYNDPSTLRYGLPKYACPDLTNKPGYWAKALPERFCSQSTVLFYYVTPTGEVHFGVNGEEKGVFFSGVETRGPLWALVDVYGNSTAIEFVDTRNQLNNRRNEYDDGVGAIVQPMNTLHINQEENSNNYPPLRHQPHVNFQPLPLHRTKGKNIRFNGRSVASRVDSEFCQGYVFSGRPLHIGERVTVQVLATEPMFQGCLSMGLTSCDPSSLLPNDLPDDSNFLLDRPEYWVISRNFARNLNVGDEISFCISHSGEVQIRRNNSAPCVIIHVDQTLKLWAFFDVYGSTRQIRVLSSSSSSSTVSNGNVTTTTPTRSESRLITPTNESMNSLNSQSELRRNSSALIPQNRICLPNGGELQVHNVNGFTVTLRPTTNVAAANVAAAGIQQGQGCVLPVVAPAPVSSIPAATSSNVTGTILSTCSSTYVEPVASPIIPSSSTTATTTTAMLPTSVYHQTWDFAQQQQHGGAGTECTICYENSIDAVLYMCGHMCMCYECALQQWRGKGGGHCPLCRAVIRDVIRTYKS